MVYARLIFLIGTVVSMFLSGCAIDPWVVQHYPLSNATFESRTPPEKVQVFRRNSTPPTVAHEEVAQISVRAKLGVTEILSSSQNSVEATMQVAIRRASLLGADAIKEVEIYVAPTGTIGAGGVSVSGIAIRWRRP